MVKIFIAGPMTGIPLYNEPMFSRVYADLKNIVQDAEIVHPFMINTDHANWLACMRRSITEIMTCDEVYFLPGWQNSRGAKIEYDLVESLGITKVLVEFKPPKDN
jgi:hypothetical protein